MSDDGTVRLDWHDGGVATITLDLPERRNAMTPAMTRAWDGALESVRADERLRALVVTGEGRAFSAGGDLGWIGTHPGASVDVLRQRMIVFYRSWLAVRDLPVPTIAAVNGAAVGAGLCLALACDLRYAARSARFSAPFSSLGIHAGMAATWLLPEAVGVSRAREMLFTGRTVDAEEALRIGLVHDVWADDALTDEVLGIAARVASMAPLAIRLTKAGLSGGGHASFETALQWEALAQPVTLATEDLQEGLRAVAEKRPPRFTGR